jgi:hydrogenase maturation protease
MNKLHVLGIGSPFGDDHLGWDVVKRLQQQPSLVHFSPRQLHLEYCDRPGMHLLELMRAAPTIFLIDAVKTGASIGTLHRLQNEDIETLSDTLSTHALGVAEAMKMGAALQLLPENVVLYGIEIGDVHGQLTLTAPIKRAIKTLTAQIERDILSLLTPARG